MIADLFEDSEYTEPAKNFQNAGHELVHVGLNSGETVKGKKKYTPVINQATKYTNPVMPDLVRHPVSAWIALTVAPKHHTTCPAFAGMTTSR
ncbi:MAG: DJ-1/PfpI family protein [Deltaproteobacteria bacterium]|nr:DJ-1/PfpI family protein [Deltaproteobacteria bacterium]MBW2601473.1 DJ-1/PfpI family protein [Deltaproteobacteria bacterium]